jgi:hypothetical protein
MQVIHLTILIQVFMRSEIDQSKHLLVDQLLDLVTTQLMQVGARQCMHICCISLGTIFYFFAFLNLEANRPHLPIGEDNLNWERVRIFLPCQVWVQFDISLGETNSCLMLGPIFFKQGSCHIEDW